MWGGSETADEALVMSPVDLLSRLIAIFPEFSKQWDEPSNCFRDEDGSFTYCGAFAEFSSFFNANYEHLRREQIAALSDLLDECMTKRQSDLDTAATTCFLENVAGEPFHDDFATYLRDEALTFYQNWNLRS